MSKNGKIMLVEKGGRMQTFNLPHEVYCSARGRCSCRSVVVTLVDENKRTGVRRPRPSRRRFPASITLLPRQRSAPLPREVLQCPEIANALKDRPRRLTFVEAD
jgi:hypothetical protein